MLGFSGIQSMDGMQQKMINFGNDVLMNAKDCSIQVLLVDHDQECLEFTAQMLELFSYKVSKVEFASTALSMLSNGNHFDVVIANIHSPDFQVLTLLEKAVSMKTLVVLMSAEEEEEHLAKTVLERGAFLLISKPVSYEFGKSLWQHVTREKLKNNAPATTLTNECRDQGAVTVAVTETKNNSKGKKIARDETTSEDNDRETNRRRTIIEWTTDLHIKFMDAVYQLGEGRCYPKEILEKMNVPGLTRLQVASHLQKCRNEIWKAPEVRKNLPHQHRRYLAQPRSGKKKDKVKKFGMMPPLMQTIKNPGDQEEQSKSNDGSSQRSDESNDLSSENFDFPIEADEDYVQVQTHDQTMMPIGLKLSVENLEYYNPGFSAAEYGDTNNTIWNQYEGNILVNASDSNENLQTIGGDQTFAVGTGTGTGTDTGIGTGTGEDDLLFEFPAGMDNVIRSFIDWNKGLQCS